LLTVRALRRPVPARGGLAPGGIDDPGLRRPQPLLESPGALLERLDLRLLRRDRLPLLRHVPVILLLEGLALPGLPLLRLPAGREQSGLRAPRRAVAVRIPARASFGRPGILRRGGPG